MLYILLIYSYYDFINLKTNLVRIKKYSQDTKFNGKYINFEERVYLLLYF